MDLQGQSEERINVPVKINAKNIESEVSKMLQCPVCYEVITPPIILCSSGHAICSHCRKNMTECPTCRGQFTEIRCRFAEDFLDKCLVQCRYHEAGCQTSMPGRELALHHESCDYRPLNCPTCGEVIDHDSFLNHLRDVEKIQFEEETESIAGFIIEAEDLESQPGTFLPWVPCWIRAYHKDFFCFLNMRNPQFWIWVGLFGTEEECQDYTCSIKVSDSERKTELTYAGKIHPIRTRTENIMRSGYCLSMRGEIVTRLRCNEAINVRFRIDRICADPPAPTPRNKQNKRKVKRFYGRKGRR